MKINTIPFFLTHTYFQNHLFIFLSLFFFIHVSCKTSKNLTKENNSKSKKIEEKYAEILKVDKEKITNAKLYQLIDAWNGRPYKYGGNSKKGIDCSNFAAIIYSEIYNKTLNGSSVAIFNQCEEISKNNLTQGDLIFFKIESTSISHVGVYLINNKFVHVTTKKGIMIDDLEDDYYKKYFYKAGRIK